MAGVFAGGDVANGSGAVIDAAGGRAAASIDRFLGGDGITERKRTKSVVQLNYIGRREDRLSDLKRVKTSELPISDQKPYYKRNAEFVQNAQTHVDMVRHQVALDKSNTSLPAQILYNPACPFSKMPIQILFTVLRNDHNIVFAFPSDMR